MLSPKLGFTPKPVAVMDSQVTTKHAIGSVFFAPEIYKVVPSLAYLLKSKTLKCCCRRHRGKEDLPESQNTRNIALTGTFHYFSSSFYFPRRLNLFKCQHGQCKGLALPALQISRGTRHGSSSGGCWFTTFFL